MKVKFAFLLSIFSALPLAHADIEKDFDGLGGNRILLEKAQAIDPEAQVTVVQERTVSRRNRWELAPEFSGSFGGDAYVRTVNTGMNVHYHLTPQWSLGLKYNRSFNKVTDEGDALLKRAVKDFERNPESPSGAVPEMDYQKSEQMAFVNWYPIYGKMNLLDKGVAQFDAYVLAGAGQVELASGVHPSYSAGGGVGIWWNQKFSTRLEMRYQTYKAQSIAGERDVDLTLASAQMGWLL